MARREPFTQIEVYERRLVLGKPKPNELPSILGEAKPGELPSEAELVDLAKQAGVPAAGRVDFVQKLRAEIRLYRLNALVSRQEEPSRQAEALRQGALRAEMLQHWLASLPDALRMRVEPDMIGLVATRTGCRPRGPLHMPGFDAPLADLIHRTKAEGARQEARVSRTRSRRRATHYRDDFALALKALAVTYSPKFAKDQRVAERWVLTVLDVLDIDYPDPEARRGAFRRMFIVNGTPPTNQAEPPAEPEDTKDEVELLERIGDLKI
jgi:hypothetical protein